MGLMLNIGQMAMAHVLGQEYVQMLGEARQKNIPVTALEVEKWSADHYALGEKMLESWKIPAELTAVIGNFNPPENEEDQTTKILQVAQQMADMLFDREIRIEQIDAIKMEAKPSLALRCRNLMSCLTNRLFTGPNMQKS